MMVALAAAISLVIVIVAYRMRALTVSGAIAAFFVGVGCLGEGGLGIGVPLFAFFVSGSLLSRMARVHLSTATIVARKGATRDAMQVLANGGAAAVCAVLGALESNDSAAQAGRFFAAAVCALAVAAADTWSTEIGARSASPPRSILTRRQVAVGVSGGVTALGTLASIAGAALIALLAGVFDHRYQIQDIAIVAAIGFGGGLFDSVLGATVQGAWRCDECGAPCEAPRHSCGARAHLVRGLAWLDNDGVNAISTIAGALAGYLVWPSV